MNPAHPRVPARRLGAMLLACLVLAAGCSDDGGLLSDADSPVTGAPTIPPATVTAPDTTATTTSLPSKVGDGDRPPSSTPVPPDAVPFEPPVPKTTPNVTQPADSLLDGEHVAFMVDVDVAGRSVDIDVVQWFYRPDYPTAIAEGRLSADDGCLELDYCIANAQDRVRTMPVAAGARVSIVDWDDCCGSLRTDDLDDVFVRMREGRDLFLVTVQSGQIVALDEIYLA